MPMAITRIYTSVGVLNLMRALLNLKTLRGNLEWNLAILVLDNAVRPLAEDISRRHREVTESVQTPEIEQWHARLNTLAEQFAETNADGTPMIAQNGVLVISPAKAELYRQELREIEAANPAIAKQYRDVVTALEALMSEQHTITVEQGLPAAHLPAMSPQDYQYLQPFVIS